MDQRIRLALTDSEGDTAFGSLPGPAEHVAVRTAAVTKLPWTIHVASTDDSEGDRDTPARRRLLLAGLSILAVLLVVSSHLIVRAMTRELAVARLQSDFVAAVSHEFRTPLTSPKQFTDLLTSEDEPDYEERRVFHQAQARATERLRRLLETLLR